MRLPSPEDFIEDSILDKIFTPFVNEAKSQFSTAKGKPSAEDIKRAINERFYVGIYYEEPNDKNLVKSGFRLIEPYVYGRGFVAPKIGNISHFQRQYIRAYVIKDTASDAAFIDKKKFTRRKSVSKTNRVPYWRLLRVDRISNWMLIPRKFSRYRHLYNPDDKMINRIICKVEYNQFPKGKI